MWGKDWSSVFCIQLSWHPLLVKVFSTFPPPPPVCIALVLLSKINCLHMCESVSGLCILFHYPIYLSLCQYRAIYCSFTVILEISISLSPLLFFKVVLAILHLLHFHINFRINKTLLGFWWRLPWAYGSIRSL